MSGQISLFDGSIEFRVDKPVRLIELFAGIGSQAKAMERLGVEFEHWRICEFDKYAVCAYNAIHGTDFSPSDITKLRGGRAGHHGHGALLLHTDLLFPLPGFEQGGKGARDGQEQRHPLRITVGGGAPAG